MRFFIRKGRQDDAAPRTMTAGRPITANSSSEYRRALQEIADRLPWLGIAPYEASLTRRPPKDVMTEPDYTRRILLSWLVGRPVSQVAKRAGCSTRLAYRVLDRVVYRPDMEEPMLNWVELGLAAVVDGPRLILEPRRRKTWKDTAADPWTAPVVCLVCHRVGGEVPLYEEDRRYDGSIIAPGDERWSLGMSEDMGFQAHLVCHFLLEDDPIRLPGQDPWDRLRVMLSPPEIAQEAEERIQKAERIRRRRHWSDSVDVDVLEAVERYHERGRPELLPVKEGREMRREEVRRWWLGMLGT